MFQVSGLVLDILLILRVPFDLVPDNIHKSSQTAQALAEEGFELRPSYKDQLCWLKGHAVAETPTGVARALLYCT